MEVNYQEEGVKVGSTLNGSGASLAYINVHVATI